MKQVGGFEIPLYKHAVKVFVGLPDDVMKYTFYVIGPDGTPMYPYKMSGQIDPVSAWTINIEKAVTWDKIEDFDCLLPEYENPVIVGIKKDVECQI